MEAIKVVEYNIKKILKVACKIAGTIFSGLSIVLSFVTWEEIRNQGGPDKFFVFGCIIFSSVLFAPLWICVLRREFTVYEKGNSKICVRYGDIIRFGFPKRGKKNRIVVVPVNTGFDTIVDENIAGNRKPLVSPKTIHGKWLLKICEQEMDRSELDEKISGALQDKKPVQELKREERERGNLKNYDIGTVIPIDSKNNDITFLLVALSGFDKNNNAHSSREKVIQCVESILKFHYQEGQGYDIYLPLLGTGMSGAELSPKESLRILKSFFQLHAGEVRGKVNIVIFQKQKSQVSIFD